MSEVCLWCFKKHKDGTKIKAKHERILEKIRKGAIPCEVGECRTYLCRKYQKVIWDGLQVYGNCNELLAMLNRVNYFLDMLLESSKT